MNSAAANPPNPSRPPQPTPRSSSTRQPYRRWVLQWLWWTSLVAPTLHGAPLNLQSPAGTVEVRFPEINQDSQLAGLAFQVRFAGQHRLAVDLGLSADHGNLFASTQIKDWHLSSSNTTYTIPLGKSSPVLDRFTQATLELQQGTSPQWNFQVILRAYEDGVAYRVRVPRQGDLDQVAVTDESTRFRLPGNPRMWPLFRDGYTTSHEGRYDTCALRELQTGRLIDLPLLAEYEDGFSVALTEAGLRDYAGLYLRAESEGPSRALRCDLSPLPGLPGVKTRTSLPMATPWRVILLGRKPGQLIESNLILNLNEPASIDDLSWLQAGKTTWYWWNGPYQEPVPFTVGLNWETMKHYIDFCARNDIRFHAIMSTPDGYPWYRQSQQGYAPGPDSDVTRARAGFPMARVAQYARSKGVALRLWAHWKPLSDRLEEAFAQYEQWGIAGLMVDFLDRDDQQMVRFAERVLESAAKHHLHIQFHGVWKPTGLRRTYPNLFNHEGVLNLEYLKWSSDCDPEHNLVVPFTRMLAGPMDYHSGGFRSVSRAAFKPMNFKPVVLGSRCHHLAMYVVYENPMPMVADAPTAYEGQPGWDFIREVPTTWDETRVLIGQVGDVIVIARRRADVWYLGAMTDWTPRELEVPLAFLGNGLYRATVWADDPTADDPNRLVRHQLELGAQDRLHLNLAGGGGAAVRLQPRR